MILILCRTVFLLTELNELEASTRIVSDLSSSYISCIACTINSQPAPCPAQTCNEPTGEIRSFQIWVTMTLLDIRHNISPIPYGWRLAFLSRGIKQHAKNGSNDGERLSVLHSFLMTSAMALNKLMRLVPNCFVIKIPLRPLASSPDSPALLFLLTAALFSESALIASSFIECACSDVSVSKTSNSASLPCGCFCFN